MYQTYQSKTKLSDTQKKKLKTNNLCRETKILLCTWSSKKKKEDLSMKQEPQLTVNHQYGDGHTNHL